MTPTPSSPAPSRNTVPGSGDNSASIAALLSSSISRTAGKRNGVPGVEREVDGADQFHRASRSGIDERRFRETDRPACHARYKSGWRCQGEIIDRAAECTQRISQIIHLSLGGFKRDIPESIRKIGTDNAYPRGTRQARIEDIADEKQSVVILPNARVGRGNSRDAQQRRSRVTEPVFLDGLADIERDESGSAGDRETHAALQIEDVAIYDEAVRARKAQRGGSCLVVRSAVNYSDRQTGQTNAFIHLISSELWVGSNPLLSGFGVCR